MNLKFTTKIDYDDFDAFRAETTITWNVTLTIVNDGIETMFVHVPEQKLIIKDEGAIREIDIKENDVSIKLPDSSDSYYIQLIPKNLVRYSHGFALEF